jgi:hypothetical protein
MSSDQPSSWAPSSIVLPFSVLGLIGGAVLVGQRYGAHDDRLQTLSVRIERVVEFELENRDRLAAYEQRLLAVETALDLRRK